MQTPAWTCLFCIPHQAEALGEPRFQAHPSPYLKGGRGLGGLEAAGALGGEDLGPLQQPLRWPPPLELSSQLFQQVWPQGGEWAARCPLSPSGP